MAKPLLKMSCASLSTDKRNPNSILSCLNLARENARIVRENISTEMWEVVDALLTFGYRIFQTHAGDLRKNHSPAELIRFYKEISRNMMLFTGAMEDTIAHAEAWHFGRMGRFLERAEKTCRILDMKYFILLPKVTDVGTSLDQLQWAALLKSTSGLQVYRRQHGSIDPKRSPSFSCSTVSFPGGALLPDLDQPLTAQLTGTQAYSYNNIAEKRTGALLSELDYKEFPEILAYGLHEYMDHLQLQCNGIGDAIAKTFFSPGE